MDPGDEGWNGGRGWVGGVVGMYMTTEAGIRYSRGKEGGVWIQVNKVGWSERNSRACDLT